MNIRDCAIHWYLDLHEVMRKLNTLDDCEDSSDMIELARELSCDIDTTLGQIDSEFELDMQEEFNL